MSGHRARLHPLTVAVGSAREVVGILVAGAAGLAAAGPTTGAWFALVGWALASLHQVAKWTTFSYVVHADRLELRRAFIGRSVTSIPVERIRGVDITASPLHRLFGLAIVLIDAGGGDDEGRLDAVSREEAERLRTLLLAGPTEPQVIGRRPGTGGRVLVRSRPSWYLYAPLSGAYLLTPFVLLGVLYNLTDDLGLLGDRWIVRAAGEAARIQLLPMALAALGLMAVLPVASVIVFAVFNWDFTVRITAPGEVAAREPAHAAPTAVPTAALAGELVAERGIGTRRSVSLERRRLRGVELRDNPLERLAGVTRLGAVVTGLGDSEHRGRLLPAAPRKITQTLAEQIIGPIPAPLARHPPQARTRRVIRAIVPPLLVGLIALAALRPWIAAACAAVALAAVPLGLDRYRQLGHARDQVHLAVRSGSLRRRLAVVEHRAIVGWQIRQTFFQRRAGLATLVAAVGAGDGAYPIVDLADTDAAGLAAEITPGWLEPFVERRPQTG